MKFLIKLSVPKALNLNNVEAVITYLIPLFNKRLQILKLFLEIVNCGLKLQKWRFRWFFYFKGTNLCRFWTLSSWDTIGLLDFWFRNILIKINLSFSFDWQLKLSYFWEWKLNFFFFDFNEIIDSRIIISQLFWNVLLGWLSPLKHGLNLFHYLLELYLVLLKLVFTRNRRLNKFSLKLEKHTISSSKQYIKLFVSSFLIIF